MVQIILKLSGDEIYNDVLEKIIDLDYYPGQKLSENQLAEIYGVSRSVIRKVLIKLEELQLVSIIPNRGTYVTLLDKNCISDIMFVRLSIEKEVLSRLMQKGAPEDFILKLEDNLNRQREYFDAPMYVKEFGLLDAEFHSILTHGAGIDNLSLIFERPNYHLSRWRNISVLSDSGLKKLINQHTNIVNFLKEGNVEKTLESIDDHLTTINENVINNLDLQYKKYFIDENHNKKD